MPLAERDDAVARENGPMSAPLLMICSSFLFATMGVCVKLASDTYGPGEIVMYRGPAQGSNAARVRLCFSRAAHRSRRLPYSIPICRLRPLQ